MQMQLRVLTGSHRGKMIAINHEKFLIGRSDECQLRPKSESISRRHCAIVRKDDKLLLIDLKSRNGTIVNGKKLDPSRAKILKHGDHIKLGKLEFEVVMEVGVAKSKKPAVKDVKDAVARTAEKSVSDSRYEEVDVTSWLEEPDQFDRRNDTEAPATRQMTLDELSSGDESGDSTVMELQEDADTQTDRKVDATKEEGKAPKPVFKPNQKKASSSRDAATETLRKFFSGR
ncbi:MAG: peptide-binding protein [Pirellulaceae bacterium]|nr:MAG: peptide-binding protein [Pirellulaceae bacterium]